MFSFTHRKDLPELGSRNPTGLRVKFGEDVKEIEHNRQTDETESGSRREKE